VPTETIRRLQDYLRLRGNPVGAAASQVQKMQKALEEGVREFDANNSESID
jgi:hypothetical protein